MKKHVEIELKLKGKYKPAQKQTETDPSWPSYIEDFEVWLGETNITDYISAGELEMLENEYHEYCEEPN